MKNNVFLWTILLSCVSSILYWISGRKGVDKYVGGLDNYFRDVGCSLVAFFWMSMFYPEVAWYIHLISFGLMWGAVSSYWDFTGKDDYFLHGMGIGLAYLAYAWTSGAWVGFGIRVIVLSALMGGLNWFVHRYHIPFSAWIEELFRGAIIVLSMPLLIL